MDEKINIDKFLAEVEQEVKAAYESGNFEKAICCSKFLCSFYYGYDYKYCDEQLETYAGKCAKSCVGELVIEGSDENKVFFYDKFGLINRGIATIYIKAFLNLGYDITWCLFEQGDETEQILAQYAGEEHIRFELIPPLSVIDRMYCLRDVILRTNAYHYFIYTTPFDVECLGVFSVMTGDIRRYLINLTDHTFWLGTHALDRCIDFRNYGANLSVKCRKIAKEKIVILPYYPEKRLHAEYQGMPFGEEDDFVFSGGGAYKIEGSDKYEQMVSEILDRHPDLKFVFATSGKSSKLDMLSLKYKERFFVIKERADLYEILKRARFLLSTYPVPGGMMYLYALANNCMPLCLLDRDSRITSPVTLLLNSDKIDFAFYEMDELLEKADQLLAEDSQERNMNLGKHFIISEKEFEAGLSCVLKGEDTKYQYYEEDIDDKSFHAYYKSQLTQEAFRQTVQRSNNKWLAEKYPELFCGK